MAMDVPQLQGRDRPPNLDGDAPPGLGRAVQRRSPNLAVSLRDKRGLDALNYACYQDARFMLVATPSGVTLAPEGGAHQSIATPLIGMLMFGWSTALLVRVVQRTDHHSAP